MVLTGSLELKLLAGRPPTKRVWGCGPSALWTRWRGAFWLRVWLPFTTSWICCVPQRTDTWVEEVPGQLYPRTLGRRQLSEGIPRALLPTPFLLNLSPCATGQPVSVGGSGPGAGAQGLPSVRRSVHGSERVPVKDHGLTGGWQRARGPGK